MTVSIVQISPVVPYKARMVVLTQRFQIRVVGTELGTPSVTTRDVEEAVTPSTRRDSSSEEIKSPEQNRE